MKFIAVFEYKENIDKELFNYNIMDAKNNLSH